MRNWSVKKSALALLIGVTALTMNPGASASPNPAESGPALVAVEDQIAASGKFQGRSNHKASGTVSIVKADSGYIARLESDFNFDGAPDPKLGFGNDGYDKSTKFAALKSNKGAQTYALPASIDPAKYNEFWIWCERFNVPLGVARLK